MENIVKQIYDSVEMIAGEIIAKAGYDRTVQATVLKQVDSLTNKYKVRYQDSIFDAYAANPSDKYDEKTSVYVLIPNNDLESHKTILGRVKNEGLQSQSITAKKNRYIEHGINIIELKKDFGLCSFESYDPEKNQIVIYSDEEPNLAIEKLKEDFIITDKVKINIAGLKQYITENEEVNRLKVGGTFQTSLPEEQQYRGNYGLLFVFEGKEDDATKDYSFILSLKDMTGTPYKYLIPSEQTLYTDDISDYHLSKIKKIVFFEEGFPHSATLEKKNADIFLKGLILQGCEAISAEQMQGTFLKLLAPKGSIFFKGEPQAERRPLEAQIWSGGTKVAAIEDSQDYYWFKEDASAQANSPKSGYHVFGGNGWKCLNSVNSTTGDFLGASNIYYVKKSDVPFYKQEYKVVGIYNSIKLEKQVAIVNLDAEYRAELKTKSGTTVYTKSNNSTEQIELILQQKKGENSWVDIQKDSIESITWYSEDENGNFSFAIEPIEGNWKIINVPLTFQTKKKYFCRIVLKNNINYSTSISLKKVQSLTEKYSLIINNNQSFQYDEEGISPASQSARNPQVIERLTFDLIDNKTGEAIDKKTIRTIIWSFPDPETSMIVPPVDGVLQYNDEDMAFSIREEYKENRNQNVISLKVVYNGIDLYAWEQINFTKQGAKGTNGTAYRIKVQPSNDGPWKTSKSDDGICGDIFFIPYIKQSETEQKITFKAYENETDKEFTSMSYGFTVSLFYQGQTEALVGPTVGTTTDHNGETVKVEWEMLRHSGQGLQEDSLYAVNEDRPGAIKVPSTFEIDKTKYPSDWTNQEILNDFFSTHCHILRAKVTYKKLELTYDVCLGTVISFGTVTNSDNSENVKVLPNIIDLSLKKGMPPTGFCYVRYQQDGTSGGAQPEYANKNPFQVVSHFPKTTEFRPMTGEQIEWYAIGKTVGQTISMDGNPKNQWIDSEDLIVQESLKIQQADTDTILNDGLQVLPAKKYSGICWTNAVTGAITREPNDDFIIYIHIPVDMQINRYANGVINAWDGNSIDINEEDGVILAPQVVAGKKEVDNSFTGVVIGVSKTKKANGEQRKWELEDNTGVFGLSHGERSFFLNSEDGSATFGLEGDGSIKIKPRISLSTGELLNNATIESGNYKFRSSKYTKEDNDGKGLQIGFGNEPYIRYGTGLFQVDSNGNLVAQNATIQGSFEAKNQNSYDESEIQLGVPGKDSTIVVCGYDDDKENPQKVSQIKLTNGVFETVLYGDKVNDKLTEQSYLRFNKQGLSLKGNFQADTKNSSIKFTDNRGRNGNYIRFLERDSKYKEEEVIDIQNKVAQYEEDFNSIRNRYKAQEGYSEATDVELQEDYYEKYKILTQEKLLYVLYNGDIPSETQQIYEYNESEDSFVIATNKDPNKKYYIIEKKTTKQIYEKIDAVYNSIQTYLDEIYKEQINIEKLRAEHDRLYSIQLSLQKTYSNSIPTEEILEKLKDNNDSLDEVAGMIKTLEIELHNNRLQYSKLKLSLFTLLEVYGVQSYRINPELDSFTNMINKMKEKSSIGLTQEGTYEFFPYKEEDVETEKNAYLSDCQRVYQAAYGEIGKNARLLEVNGEFCFALNVIDKNIAKDVELFNEIMAYVNKAIGKSCISDNCGIREYEKQATELESQYVRGEITEEEYQKKRDALIDTFSDLSGFYILDLYGNILLCDNNFSIIKNALLEARANCALNTIVKAKTDIGPGKFEFTSYETYDNYLNSTDGVVISADSSFTEAWDKLPSLINFDDVPSAGPAIKSSLKYDAESATLKYYGDLEFSDPPFAKLIMTKQSEEGGANRSELAFKEFFYGDYFYNPVDGTYTFLHLSDIANDLNEYTKSIIQLKSGLFKLATFDYPEAFVKTDKQLNSINEHSIVMKDGKMTLRNLEFSLKTPCVDVAFMNESKNTHINMTGYKEDKDGTAVKDTSVEITPFKFKITGQDSCLFYNPQRASFEYRGDLSVKNANGTFIMRGRREAGIDDKGEPVGVKKPELKLQFGTTLKDYSAEDSRYGKYVQLADNSDWENLKVTEFKITPTDFLMCSYGPEEIIETQTSAIGVGNTSKDSSYYMEANGQTQEEVNKYFCSEFIPDDHVSPTIITYLDTIRGVDTNAQTNLTDKEKQIADFWLQLFYGSPYISQINISYSDSGHVINLSKEVPPEFEEGTQYKATRKEFQVDSNGDYYFNENTQEYEPIVEGGIYRVKYKAVDVIETIQIPADNKVSDFEEKGISYSSEVSAFDEDEKPKVRWIKTSGLQYNSKTGKFSLSGDFTLRNKHGSVMFTDDIMRITFRSYEQVDDKEIIKTRMCIGEDSFYFYTFGDIYGVIPATPDYQTRAHGTTVYNQPDTSKSSYGISGGICWSNGELKITGNIKATSGEIGGWQISRDGISCGGLRLGSDGTIEGTNLVGATSTSTDASAASLSPKISSSYLNRRTGLFNGGLVMEGSVEKALTSQAAKEFYQKYEGQVEQTIKDICDFYEKDVKTYFQQTRNEYIVETDYGTEAFIRNHEQGLIKYELRKNVEREAKREKHLEQLAETLKNHDAAVIGLKEVYKKQVQGAIASEEEETGDLTWQDYGIIQGGYGMTEGLFISSCGLKENYDLKIDLEKGVDITAPYIRKDEMPDENKSGEIPKYIYGIKDNRKETFAGLYFGLNITKDFLDQQFQNAGSSEMDSDTEELYKSLYEKSIGMTMTPIDIDRKDLINLDAIEEQNKKEGSLKVTVKNVYKNGPEDEGRPADLYSTSLNFVIGIAEIEDKDDTGNKHRGYIYGTQIMPHKVRTYDTELIREKPKNYVLEDSTSLEKITNELGSLPTEIKCETEGDSKSEEITKVITETHTNGTKIWKITLKKPEETVTSEDEWNVTEIKLVDENDNDLAIMAVEGFSMLT